MGERTFELRNRAKVLFYKIVVNADFINLYEMQTGVTVSFGDVVELVDMLETSYPKNGVSKIGLLRAIANAAGFTTVKHVSNGIYSTTDGTVGYGGTFNMLVGTYEREIKQRQALNETLGARVGSLSSAARGFIQFLQEVKDTPLEKRIIGAKLDRFQIFLRSNCFAVEMERSTDFCKMVFECESVRIAATVDLKQALANTYPHTSSPKIKAGLHISAKGNQDTIFEINAVYGYFDANAVTSTYRGLHAYNERLAEFTKMLSLRDTYGSIETTDFLVSVFYLVANCPLAH